MSFRCPKFAGVPGENYKQWKMRARITASPLQRDCGEDEGMKEEILLMVLTEHIVGPAEQWYRQQPAEVRDNVHRLTEEMDKKFGNLKEAAQVDYTAVFHRYEKLSQGTKSYREYVDTARGIKEVLPETMTKAVSEKMIEGMSDITAKQMVRTMARLQHAGFEDVAAMLLSLEPHDVIEVQPREAGKSSLFSSRDTELRDLVREMALEYGKQQERALVSLTKEFTSLNLNNGRRESTQQPSQDARTIVAPNIQPPRQAYPVNQAQRNGNGYGAPPNLQRRMSNSIAPAMDFRNPAHPDHVAPEDCFHCYETGHRISDCPHRPLPNEERNRRKREYQEKRGVSMPQQAAAAQAVLNQLEPDTISIMDPKLHCRVWPWTQAQLGAHIQGMEYSAEAFQAQAGPFPLDAELNAAGEKRGVDEADLSPNPTIPKSNSRSLKGPNKRAVPKPYRHINFLGGKPKIDILDKMLTQPIRTEMNISMASILDISPYLTAQFGKAMVRPLLRKSLRKANALPTGTSANTNHPRPAAEVNLMTAIPGVPAVSGLTNFYTFGMIRVTAGLVRTTRILLDGGATANIINRKLVTHLSLPIQHHEPRSIRMGNGEDKPLSEETTIVLDVAGLLREVSFLIIDGNTTYTMLLGRGYLKSAGALDDFENDQVMFRDSTGHRVVVPREDPTTKPGVIPTNQLPQSLTKSVPMVDSVDESDFSTDEDIDVEVSNMYARLIQMDDRYNESGQSSTEEGNGVRQ